LTKSSYVVIPSTSVNIEKKYYIKNKRGETGKFVQKGFEYNSGKNKKFMGTNEIKTKLKA